VIGRLVMTADARFQVARWCGRSWSGSLWFAAVGTWRLWRSGELDALECHGRDRVGL
jgi:hypothetical protein